MKKIIRTIACISLLSIAFPSFAANLLEVYEDAAGHDPTYKKAAATRLVAREAKPQSIAGLLPTVGGSVSTTGYRNRFNQGPSFDPGLRKLDYALDSYQLTLTQPIFSFASWMTVRQASAIVKQADATYGASMQDLMLRVSTAYFKVLQAEDNLRITQTQKKLLARQLDEAKQRYDVGVDTMTNVFNAQANYDLAVAQEITDKNAVHTNYESLRGITGRRYDSLSKLKTKIPLISPNPADMNKWVEAARQQNLTLRASRFAADAARENIKVKAGGHVPTVNATGNYTANQGKVLSNVAADGIAQLAKESSSAGLVLNIPIFQGGLVLSQVRQAQYNYQQATADMEFNHEAIVTATRQTYMSVLADIAKINADQAAIRSNQSAYDSNEAAYRAGVKTNTDVLTTQKALFDAQRLYAADQYTYLIDTLRLKQLAGTLNEKDLQIINQWLKRESVMPAQAGTQSKK